MARSEQIDILLYKAQQDEKVVRCLMDDSEISDEVIGFHVQQAIEKLLKALLVHLNIDFPKTHVLELLVLQKFRANLFWSFSRAFENR